KAISRPYPRSAELATHDAAVPWQQHNTNLLQIENELCSTIQPIRIKRSGEKLVQALAERRVEYAEAPCLAVDPILSLRIETATAYFLDSFLLFCALAESPAMSDEECRTSSENFDLTVMRGREPGLQLTRKGQPCELLTWGEHLLDNMAACAALLDQAHGT